MSSATITETCACGATFRITAWPPHAASAARDWRDGHQHAESVGICGDQPPPITGGKNEIPSPHCTLLAGHAGMHSSGDGQWWRYAHDAHRTAPLAPEQTAPGEEGHRDTTGRESDEETR